MKLLVSVETLEKIASKLGARFNPSSYFVCYDVGGRIVFVPTKSSRHTHTIVVPVSDAEREKVIKWATSKGFEILEECLALPESA